MNQRFTWKKKEKLKSRKRIERVFREGKSFSLFPYRVCYLLQPRVGTPRAGAKAAPGHTLDTALTPGATPAAGATLDATPTPGATPVPGATALLPFSPLQAGFGASSRHFKKAVDRNRIKRLGREAYRLQKQALLDRLVEKDLSMAVFFIYTGKELPDYRAVTEKLGLALQKLIREIT